MSECMQQRNVNETMERAWLEGAAAAADVRAEGVAESGEN